MLPNFTDPARRAMLAALREAEDFEEQSIATEHLLLGLLMEGAGVAADVLRGFGIDERRVRAEVEKSVAAADDGQAPSTTQTARARRALDYATEEARNLNHDALGTGHLLLGLLREPDGLAVQTLVRLGVVLEDVRRAALERLQGEPEGAAVASQIGPEPGAPVNGLLGTASLYDRFTGQARRVILLAHREAHRFGHDYVGTEHLLLGVLQEGSGRVVTLLKACGVATETVRLEIEKVVQQGPEVPVGARLPLTPPARRALQFAGDEARRLHHEYVGPEHVLLGILHEPDGQAAQVLAGLGLDLGRLREQALQLPPSQDRDTMLQPAGGTRAADPSAEELGRLVSAHLPAAPAVVRGRRQRQPSSEPIITTPSAAGLALQLRYTQFVLAGLSGLLVGAMLYGRAGGFLGLLAGIVVASVGSTALAVLVGLLTGILMAARLAPHSPALQMLAVFAGALVGCCFGDFVKGFARAPEPEQRMLPGPDGDDASREGEDERT
jgi:hypothetical protein